MVIDKKMRKLDEWAKDKPLGLVIFAQQAAVGVEALFKWLRSMKIEELLRDHITPPTSREWLNLSERVLLFDISKITII
jgi:hypothetical protein